MYPIGAEKRCNCCRKCSFGILCFMEIKKPLTERQEASSLFNPNKHMKTLSFVNIPEQEPNNVK